MPKGISNNPAGRPAGRPNKLTAEVRVLLKSIVSDELQRLPEMLDGMSDKDRAGLLVKLLPYTLPKLEPICMEDGEPYRPPTMRDL